jgi:hypothetical protein
MTELQIGTIAARFRLPSAAAGTHRRLGGLLREACDTRLAEAVALARARRGIGSGELLCLRRVQAPVRLRLGALDAALVTAWGLAIADAIEAQLAVAPTPTLVRYRSRGDALADLAVGAAAGDLHRAWAWCQCGLIEPPAPTTAAGAVEGLLARLGAEPEAIVPALRAVAEAGALPALAARLRADAWPRLAGAALRAAGGPALGDLEPLVRAEVRSAMVAGPAPIAPAAGNGVLTRALIAAELPRRRSVPAPALAVLGALDADPGIGSNPRRAARAVAALIERLEPPRQVADHADGSPRVADPRSAEPPRPEPVPEHGRQRVEAPERGPNGERPMTSTAPDVAGSTAGHPDGPVPASGDRTPAVDGPPVGAAASLADGAEPSAARARRPTPVPRADTIAGGTVEPVSAEVPAEGRDPSRTRHGGLLFLLPILRLLDLPPRMAAAPELAEAPLRLGLHRLGLALAGCAADDPALAAFCGLPALPDRSCVGPDDPGIAAAVAGWADEVRDALARRCVPDDDRRRSGRGSGLRPRPTRDAERRGMHSHAERGNAMDAAATLAWLVERDAQVIASPGWIELVFSLDGVSLALRRAGLDLDPGWVPWLGVVIRYRYE